MAANLSPATSATGERCFIQQAGNAARIPPASAKLQSTRARV